MQLLEASSVRRRTGIEFRRLPGLLVGAALVGAGLWMGLRELLDGSLATLVAEGRSSPLGVAGGAAAWTVAVVGPATLILAGASRILPRVGRLRPRARDPLLRTLRELPGERIVAVGLRLPDGRRIPALTIGPEGVVLLEALPPPKTLRVTGSTWEVRAGDGWLPVEEPLHRARRDADAVRRWLAEIAFDPPLAVRAAVVDAHRSRRPAAATPRSGACPIVAPDELAAHLAALPEAPRLTPGRQELLVARLRSALR